MGIDRNCMDQPYLAGRMVAIIETAIVVPSGFAHKVAVDPRGDMLSHYLDKAIAKGGDYADDLTMLKSKSGSSSSSLDTDGQYWIGYYNQRADIDRKRIGQQIKDRRMELNYSQQYLAKMTRMTAATISKLENGRWSASVDMLSRVASALHLELNLD